MKRMETARKILITGASGFIGSFLTEGGLERGYEVWAGVRKTSTRRYLRDWRIRFAELDLEHPERLRNSLCLYRFQRCCYRG